MIETALAEELENHEMRLELYYPHATRSSKDTLPLKTREKQDNISLPIKRRTPENGLSKITILLTYLSFAVTEQSSEIKRQRDPSQNHPLKYVFTQY